MSDREEMQQIARRTYESRYETQSFIAPSGFPFVDRHLRIGELPEGEIVEMQEVVALELGADVIGIDADGIPVGTEVSGGYCVPVFTEHPDAIRQVRALHKLGLVPDDEMQGLEEWWDEYGSKKRELSKLQRLRGKLRDRELSVPGDLASRVETLKSEIDRYKTELDEMKQEAT